jgi:hypothetical protein
VPPENIPLDLRVDLRQRWEQEGDEPLTMVPVSTLGQMSFRTPNVMPVEIASEGDAFLSAFRWSQRRSPGALLAQPLMDPLATPWELKTGASEIVSMHSEEELQRFGSVVVLQNITGLAAFSITEQRWLWSRRMPSGLSRRIFSIMNKPFWDFTSSSSPQMITGFGRRIGGGTRRWICLASEETLEVVDLYTGNRLWAMNGLKSASTVVACDSVICVSGIESAPLTLNPIEGHLEKSTNQDALAGQLGRTLRGSGDGLIVWNPGKPEQRSPRIEWTNPVSGVVRHSVNLPEMEYAQFLNRDTIVAVTDAEKFHVVDLKTGELRTLSYSEKGDGIECDLVPQRIAFAADDVNYYLFERSEDDTPITEGSMYGLRARLVHKELRAVNRRTGELAWIRPAEGTMLACFEGTESVLVFVQVVNKSRDNNLNIPGLPGLQSGQRNLIDGISRTTGRPMLSYAPVAQINYSSLRLTRNKAGHLDLEAFGNRVRFVSEPNAAAP